MPALTDFCERNAATAFVCNPPLAMVTIGSTFPALNGLLLPACTVRGSDADDQCAGRQSNDVMRVRNIRETEIFEGNAAGALL